MLQLSKHRIEALADGIFAIVATLIVLELRIPELPRNATSSMILDALKHLVMPLFSFVITFALAGSFWALHQLMMHFVTRVNGVLLWLNIAFLMFVSLLPFSTSLLGRFRLSATVPLVVYFSNQCLIGTLLWLQWRYAARKQLLSEEAYTSPRARDLPARVGALSIGAAVAVVVACFVPEFAFWGFILPTLFSRVRAVRRSRIASASSPAPDLPAPH